jgi:hypothetical protein
MVFILLTAWLAAGLDDDKAGVLFESALDKVKTKRYEEAIKDFDAALAEQPEEADKFEFDDAAGKSKVVAYYPHFESGQARVAQAREMENLEEQQKLLQDAMARLKKTAHPNKKSAVERAWLDLARVETAIKAVKDTPPPPPPKPKTFEEEVDRIRAGVNRLCAEERFEDALRSVSYEEAVFKDHEAEREKLLGEIRPRQAEAVAGRLAGLSEKLGQIAQEKGIPEAGAVLPGLKAARFPQYVRKDPPPAFVWLDRFLAFYEKEADRIGKAPALLLAEVQRLADALERLALEALDVDFLPGFRASGRLSFAIRLAHLKAVDSAAPPVAEAAWRKSMSMVEEAAGRLEAELRKRREKAGTPEETVKALKGFEEVDLAEQRRGLEEVKEARRLRGESEGLAIRVKGLENVLSSLASRTESDHGRRLAEEAAGVEALPVFASLPPAVRARTFFVHAASAAAAALLDGEPPDKAAERYSVPAAEAFKLDPKVMEPWRARLSPKILAVLDKAKGP